MGTNKEPPMDRATDVNDNAIRNAGTPAGRRDTEGMGDADKDPGLAGENMDRNRSSNTGDIAGRGDATRGPTNQPR